MPPIPDSYWVTHPTPFPGRLLAGEYPGAKDPDEATRKLGRFLDAGVTTFLDLTEEGESELRPYAAAAESLATARGLALTHRRLPILDLGVPSRQQMAAILDTIDAALARGETVYVHCYGGIGRTGTVVGCWLVRHGLGGAAAIAQIAAWRAGTPDGWKASPETRAQRGMILEWEEGR